METGASMVRGVGTEDCLYLTLVPTDEKKMCCHVHDAYLYCFTCLFCSKAILFFLGEGAG